MDRLERRIVCEDDKGRRYTVHVMRQLGSFRNMDGSAQEFAGLRKYVLADNPRRDITPVEGKDAFEILDDGTIIRGVEGA